MTDADSDSTTDDPDRPDEQTAGDAPTGGQTQDAPSGEQTEDAPSGSEDQQLPPEKQRRIQQAAGREKRDDPESRDSQEKMLTYLLWGAFGLLALLAAVATAGLYTSVLSAIDIWIRDDFQPIFRALFNLVVVLACGLALSILVRRVQVSDVL